MSTTQKTNGKSKSDEKAKSDDKPKGGDKPKDDNKAKPDEKPKVEDKPKPKVEDKPEEKRSEVRKLRRRESLSEDVSDGFVPRPRVISRFHYGTNNESHLVEFEGSERVNGSVFIEGVSGVGVTATVVSAYLIKELNLPIVASFESPHLPAMCSIHSFRASPVIRIHGDADGKISFKKKNLIKFFFICVAVGDLPISASEKSEIIWDITRAFADFARRHRCRHIVTVEGMPIKNEFDREISKIEKMLPKNPEVCDCVRIRFCQESAMYWIIINY
ncbi:nesprin [Reticulomyxa filosa]|uniref:Nesprin n=1 Tax=Reticulomyxa filosa TaxID=46433 RepID=X6NQC9_RETFI|nr:nesprin [Reticulomyxa filosa]|eukprot:ETO27884.1 nesprin [Reticulomyxa filosa]